MFASILLLFYTLFQSSANEKVLWLHQSASLRNLHQPSLSTTTSTTTTILTENSATNPSEFQWFQEIYYPNLHCQGNPYRTFHLALGDCFKDSPNTSFMFVITPDATKILSAAFSDDHCGMMSHNESDGFEGGVYEGPDSVSNCLPDSSNSQNKNDFPSSLRTFTYKTPFHQLTYPASGYVSRSVSFITKLCN
jgi:hypothetical protein